MTTENDDSSRPAGRATEVASAGLFDHAFWGSLALSLHAEPVGDSGPIECLHLSGATPPQEIRSPSGGSWPVRSHEAVTDLECEAVREATELLPGWPVVTAEHLCVLSLVRGTLADATTIARMLEMRAIDAPKLSALLQKYDLLDEWRSWHDRWSNTD